MDNISIRLPGDLKRDLLGYIITDDKDLLILKSFNSIKIINPRQLWELARKIHFFE